MTALTDLEDKVEQALGDTGNATFTVADVDRALTQAIEDYSRVSPIEQSTTKATTNQSRTIALDASTFPSLIRVFAVEYPVSKYPEHRPSFEVVDTNLYLHTDTMPSGDNARILWHKAHALPGATTTIRTEHTELVVTGAAGYALQNHAASLVNTLTTDPQAADHFSRAAQEYLTRFRAALDRIGRRLKMRSLISTAPQFDSKTTDWGP